MAQEDPVLAKKKEPERPVWASYWLTRKRPFEDDEWLRRWAVLKEELRRKIPS